MASQEHLERFQEGGIVSPEEAGAEVRRLLEDHLPSRSFFEPYRPLRHWFLRPGESGNIHGIPHEARVLIWQEILARLLIREGMSLDQEALRWAAATHDTQRIADGTDFPHGERAAAWVQRVFKHRLPAPTLERVMYLNTWHVPSDSWAPTMTAELAVLKDADSLDRVRLSDLDPQFLRWGSSKTLLQYLAEALFEGSERKQQQGWDAFDAVIETAVELGLVLAQ